MSKKNYDNHNRWRNKTVAFRVSAEEDLQLETLVKLTGLTKATQRFTKPCGISCLPCWTSCAGSKPGKA